MTWVVYHTSSDKLDEVRKTLLEQGAKFEDLKDVDAVLVVSSGEPMGGGIVCGRSDMVGASVFTSREAPVPKPEIG